MKRAFICTLVVLTLCFRVAAQTTRPIPQIHKVVIISVDGLRPDLALRANTPNIHALFNAGSYSFWARTTAESVTLPSHTSMLTGVPPVKHGIQWNADLPLIHPVYPVFPTLFELAKQAGYTTAMVVGKSKFINLAKPGTLDWQFIPNSTHVEDPEVTAQAVRMILDHQPDVLFVHFPSVDNAGHAYGWSSPRQMAAIEVADFSIGQVLEALDQRRLRDSTFILVTSDHGGAGLGHGPDDPRSRQIPWIAVGPGIRRGLDLTIYGDLVINTEDTFSTAAYLLGIPILRKVDGRPVLQIIDQSNQELLR
ncbi:MAG: ectonucleotide pyrophosphatase/phosphodiesterase [Tepidisphaeraceae bacterium]|jgi:predicted AlkP superfamily pyrophosphatase or phosphodiesterase